MIKTEIYLIQRFSNFNIWEDVYKFTDIDKAFRFFENLEKCCLTKNVYRLINVIREAS